MIIIAYLASLLIGLSLGLLGGGGSILTRSIAYLTIAIANSALSSS